MARLRIAIVTATFPPYRGGMGALAALDARQLAALGHEVTVFAPSGEAQDPSYALKRLASLRFGNAAFAPGAGSPLRDHDVVVLHYPFFGGAEPLWLARGKGDAKLVLMYHMDVVGAGPLRPFFAAHTRWLMPRIVAAADRVLVTSLDYALHGNLAPLVAADRSRFEELPPAVDVARFAPGPKPPELLSRHGFTAGDQVAVFVGGLDKPHYFKGIPVLLRALSSSLLREAKAVIIGAGDLRPSYEKLAVALGVDRRVRFAGAVPAADLPAHERLADAFVFPSIDRSEAFGIAALEAAASGVPVVASDLPGVRTVVREGETGLRAAPGSASSLALRLAELLGDEKRRRAFGEAGRRMAEGEYAEARRVERWRAVLAGLGL